MGKSGVAVGFARRGSVFEAASGGGWVGGWWVNEGGVV